MCAAQLVVCVSHQEYPAKFPHPSRDPEYIDTDIRRCPFCGWMYHWFFETDGYNFTPASYVIASELRELELNSTELRVAELATHLRRRREHLYDLSPRRFEELVTGLLRDLGFTAIHTGRSGDGGADIVLFSEWRKFGIVECKRYARERRVGVEVLRSLVGAAVDWEVRRVYIATTSSFTRGLVTKVDRYRAKGYVVELIDASTLLRLLGTYNEMLPPLERISDRQREDIINWNTRLWTGSSERRPTPASTGRPASPSAR